MYRCEFQGRNDLREHHGGESGMEISVGISLVQS
jgi:hypothetical protein